MVAWELGSSRKWRCNTTSHERYVRMKGRATSPRAPKDGGSASRHHGLHGHPTVGRRRSPGTPLEVRPASGAGSTAAEQRCDFRGRFLERVSLCGRTARRPGGQRPHPPNALPNPPEPNPQGADAKQSNGMGAERRCPGSASPPTAFVSLLLGCWSPGPGTEARQGPQRNWFPRPHSLRGPSRPVGIWGQPRKGAEDAKETA